MYAVILGMVARATLRQAITNTRDGFAIPAITIDDAPRFAWRGLMIDVARHFYSLPTLERSCVLFAGRYPRARVVRRGSRPADRSGV
jgi:hypothetical protein